MNAGSISNTATIDGLDPLDNPVTQTAGTTVTASQIEALSLTKTASPAAGVAVGDTITYTMTARNTGTLTLLNTTITDAKPGLSPLACTPAQGSSLAPGATMTCTATYTATATDIASGSIANAAVVSGDGGGGTITANGAATVPTKLGTNVDLTKTLDGVDGATATWIITVTNTGDGAFPGPFTVTDKLPAGLTFVSAAGNGWSCSGTATISCTHDAPLAHKAATSVKVVTTVTGTDDITNTASMEVFGQTVESSAAYRPASGFAFSGADAGRVGLLGLLVFVGGWIIVAATRKRDEDYELIKL